MTRRQFELHPDELPDIYVMTGDGTCMEPEIMDGTKLMFSRTEKYEQGDVVLLFRRPEFTPPGEHQLLIKRLIFAPPASYWADPTSVQFGNIAPTVLVEMLNPYRVLQCDAQKLLGIHKCLGPLPADKTTYKVTDDEVRQEARERLQRPFREAAE
ncbi:S24 family peptidase [Rhizobium rhizogenes]|uniref:S24 family peptidase n=1 Tax=Rhizobium rhizogenes TaxID=359 RepID=UPI001573FB8F|nr:S24 family peptidase [Rhizobium rhizogenes]NTG09233.1 S24 family peptidase [Rhizobium rhizogenes]